MLDAAKQQELSKPIVAIRKVLKIGPTSFYFNLPMDFVKRFGIRKGTKLAVVGDSILKVMPFE